MNTALQWMYMGAPYLIAVGLGLAAIIGPVALYLMTRKWSDSLRTTLILWGVGLAAFANVALVPRNLFLTEREQAFVFSEYLAGTMSAGWASRILSLALVGFSLSVLAGAWLAYRREKKADPMWGLGIAMALFYVVNVATGLFFAAESMFDHKSLYIPILLGALLVMVRADWSVVVRQLKWILGALMVANLLAIAIDPDFAVLRPYTSVIPGIDFRLYGVTSQANTLGPVALLLLLLELYYPSQTWLRWPLLSLASLNFLLAQSKTAWAIGLLILLVCYLPYSFSAARKGGDAVASTLKATLLTLVMLGVGVALLGLTVNNLDTRLAEDITTLTGRTSIWEQTMEEFYRYPLFGYGPSIWDIAYRIRVGNLAAGQAHNQFIQTLGESGLVGFVLLLGYLWLLFRFSLKTFRASHGLSLALFILVFARSLTEAPLRSNITDWTFFMHAVTVLVIAHYARSLPPRTKSMPHIHGMQHQGALL